MPKMARSPFNPNMARDPLKPKDPRRPAKNWAKYASIWKQPSVGRLNIGYGRSYGGYGRKW